MTDSIEQARQRYLREIDEANQAIESIAAKVRKTGEEPSQEEIGSMVCAQTAIELYNDLLAELDPPPTYPEPIPLLPEQDRTAPFPLDALGSLLAGAASAIIEAIQVPDAMAAQSVLAAAALAAQPHGNVVRDGQVIPLSLFFLTVAESGDRKTHADSWALEAHYAHQRTLQENYKAEDRVYRNKLDAYQKARTKILNSKVKTSPDMVAEQLGQLEEPIPPPLPYLLAEEPTLEGLQKAFISGPASQGLFSNEGGQFFGGYATNRDNRLKTISGLSKFWDGGGFNRMRATHGESGSCYSCRLSIHLMIQPIIATQELNDALLQNQGFLARFLIAWPESRAGQRPYREIDLTANAELNKYTRRMGSLLAQKPRIDTRGDLEPPTLPLDPVAKRAWIAAHDVIEAELGKGGDMQEIKPTAAKAAENILRIAGVMSVVEGANVITEEMMNRAYTLVRWYLDEALRLTSLIKIGQQLLYAQQLLEWLVLKGWHTFEIRSLQRQGPRFARKNAKRLLALLEILNKHHWLSTNDGKTFEINPLATAATEATTPQKTCPSNGDTLATSGDKIPPLDPVSPCVASLSPPHKPANMGAVASVAAVASPALYSGKI
jgi:hypothetical protein